MIPQRFIVLVTRHQREIITGVILLSHSVGLWVFIKTLLNHLIHGHLKTKPGHLQIRPSKIRLLQNKILRFLPGKASRV